ncbi:hypothetical protein M8C21_023737 [Ambrosia artemisiifolia]|uniref:Sodium/calcium exchanger membrane region domain-containing protein n=1 Tax=Ambrosia artemisiifolia TaxID=4212 RepID=A0AAD5C3B0_AMBAR|nr:hypothetical protein M8C21_023737 [Ambrosia artemisiifolia]
MTNPMMAYTSLWLMITLSTLLIITVTVSSRTMTTTSSSSDLITDGLNHNKHILRLNPFLSLSTEQQQQQEACEQTYGFLPCTSTAIGNLFLILVYGYLMFVAATYLSAGSELLLEILGPGLVGGLLLPSPGALPDAMLILVSGLTGSIEVAQEQVSVGMGLLAGSTVMLITVIWGACITVGKCDIQNSVAVDNQDTRGFSLETKREHDLLGDDGGEDDEEAGVDDPPAFADPLVDAVGGFSTATTTNSSEAVSAIIFATRKKQRSASLTFSENIKT